MVLYTNLIGFLGLPCLILIKILYVYCKIRKISPSMYKPSNYKPPKLVTQKTLREIAPPNKSPPPPTPGSCTRKIFLQWKVKQSKNSKFPFNYKLAQSILKCKFPSIHKPLKRAFKKYKPKAYFHNFTVFCVYGKMIGTILELAGL